MHELMMDVDSYKLAHHMIYPDNTTRMFSYLESRGGYYEKTLFFGLQYFLKKYMTTPITIADIDFANSFASAHGLPFNYDGWKKIVNKYGGYFPVSIKAVPEGCVIPTKNILVSVESMHDDPDVFWAVSWLETALSRIWYPITVATRSWHIKQSLLRFLRESADDPDGEVLFKLHDFGSRGTTCREQAAIGGAAHLVNFLGSDTIEGIMMANKYYDCQMAGFSIPASEHSTITMWGKDSEHKPYEKMIEKFGDMPIFACVSDSYDIYNACRNIWGDQLKDKINNMKAILVQRPDSGADPKQVVVDMLRIADEKFGSTINTKGYKVLNKIRIIQGDGITEPVVDEIMQGVIQSGFSATNVALGLGGGLLQRDLNRDTNRFAFKCGSAKVNGGIVDVYKDPITDPGKKSKRGVLSLNDMGGRQVRTLRRADCDNPMMREVYYCGELTNMDSLNTIRKRSNELPYNQHAGWVNRDVY